MDYDVYKSYPNKVLNGEISTNTYIKNACKRYLEFFDKYEFKPDKVEKVIKFISKLKHFTGKSSGKQFTLEEWQIWCLSSIFGFYKDGKRVCRNVYIEIARKNGKSAFISAIALYCLIADGEDGAEVDVVANSRQQAHILYDMCRNFAETIDKKGKYIQGYRDKIKFNHTKSHIQVLSSDSTTLDGYNASMFCQDEVHAAKDSKLYDVMKSSQGMRENPLAILITSAGFDLFGFCYTLRTGYIDIISGLKEDDSLFAAIYCLDDDDDWKDEKNWIKANPNIDITVSSEYLKEQVKSATNNKTLEVGVKTKNFNVWVSSSDIWIPSNLLIDASRKINISDYKDMYGYMGVDLSSVSDMTTFSLMIPQDDKYIYYTKYYLPESCLYDNPNSELYKQWKREGYLTITHGNVVDYDYILQDILRVQDAGIFISKIAYDQYNATQWAINATEQGLPLVPYSQALWNFNKPTKEFERLMKSNKIIIDNNPITRWCFQNVALKFDHNNNCKPVKGGTEMGKIDGVIAMVEALGIYLDEPKYNNEIISI